jgi:septal ring factor EnvC (AmiA/AmiB activator)
MKKEKLEFLIGLLEVELTNKKTRSEALNNRLEEKTSILEKLESNIHQSKNDIEKIKKKFHDIENSYTKYKNILSAIPIQNTIEEKLDIADFDQMYQVVKKDIENIFNLLSIEISKSHSMLEKIERDIFRKQKDLNELNQKIKDGPQDLNPIDLITKQKISILENENLMLREKIKEVETRDLEISDERSIQSDSLISAENGVNDFLSDSISKEELIHKLQADIEELETKRNDYETQLSRFKQNNEDFYNERSPEIEQEQQTLMGYSSPKTTRLEGEKEIILRQEKVINDDDEIRHMSSINADLLHEIENYRKELNEIRAYKENKIWEDELKEIEAQNIVNRKNELEKLILEHEKLNTSLAMQIKKRDNLIQELESINAELKEKIMKINLT